MQEMPSQETRSCASLLDMSDVRFEDGSSLPLVGDMRGVAKLQSFPSVPHIHDAVLFRLLWGIWGVGLEGDIE